MITRTTDTDDSGTGTDGTIHNNAWLQAIYDALDARWSEFTTTSTGSQNNFSYSEADRIRANNASTLTLTGILAPAAPAKPGKPLFLVAIGAGTVVLNNEDAASTAANRIITGTGGALTLAAGTGWAVLFYDDTSDRWRVLGSSAAAATFSPSVTTSTVTGAQNNWAPTLSTSTLVEWSGASDAAFTGLAGGATGRIVTVKNTGTKIATFAHQSASSSAGNKFRNFATSAPTPVAPGGYITYQYDGTDWMIVGHEQGAFITPAFSAGDFTASGSMTWTVDSGDITVYAYRLAGKMLAVQFAIISTTVGGTVSNNLRIKIPGGFTNTKYVLSVSLNYSDNGGGNTAGFVQVGAGNTYIECYKFSVANWTLATNATGVYGEVFFEVD